MGNALEAAKFSVENGNTGVGTKKTLLEGIDKAQLGVKTWKENIDSERLKLKTDTATKYREAEMDTMKNLPSDKTSRDLALNALAEYKDRLYGNMGLVQSGLISSDDNLIFQENGKQSFDILAQQINDYSKSKAAAIKRATGYYEMEEDGVTKKIGKDGLPIYVEPTAGGVEAALQDFHDRMGNPDFTQIGFGENGMGKVTFLKTKIDAMTNTRVLDLDENGKPQPYKDEKDMSVLAFNGKDKNAISARFNLNTEVNGLLSGGLGGKYEELKRVGNMSGVIVDDQRNNPQFFQMLETAVDTAVVTTERVASLLADNGPEAERSIIINSIQEKQLEFDGINDRDMIDYTYLDIKTGKMVTGQKYKYIKMRMASNNTLVPAATEEDIEAARNVSRTAIYGALDVKYTDKGVRDSQYAPNAAQIKKQGDDEDYQYTVKLIDQAATGDTESLQSLVSESDVVEKYTIKTIKEQGKKDKQVLNFYTFSGDKLADIVIDDLGKSVGKQIASQLKKQAEKYINKTNLKEEVAKGTDGDFNSRSREYTNLDDVVFGVNNQGVTTTTSDLFADAGTSSGKIKAAFDRTIAEMSRLYGFPEGFLTVEIDDTLDNDRMTIRDANGKEIDQFEDDDENGANVKNTLDKYMKKYKSGEVKLDKNFG